MHLMARARRMQAFSSVPHRWPPAGDAKYRAAAGARGAHGYREGSCRGHGAGLDTRAGENTNKNPNEIIDLTDDD